MNLVEREILTALSTAIGSNADTGFLSYYQGEVKVVPQSYLPALMVFGTESVTTPKDTLNDIQQFTLTIRAVINLMAFVDEAGTGDTIKSQYHLRELMEGTDPATGLYKSNSVLGVLRAKSGSLLGTYYKFIGNIRISYRTITAGQFFYVAADATVTAQSELRPRGN